MKNRKNGTLIGSAVGLASFLALGLLPALYAVPEHEAKAAARA